jgi:hypothetical protein
MKSEQRKVQGRGIRFNRKLSWGGDQVELESE